MLKADYHIHTGFSEDCNIPMEQMVKYAIKLGLKDIALTDHNDYDYPNPDYNFLINYDEYLIKFNSIKEKYSRNINIILGLEIGLQSHINQKNEELTQKYPFDFIIGSIHVGDKLDFYNGDFFKGKKQKNAYLRYFENMLENFTNFSNFDVCGHLDYIVRYGDFKEKKLSYNDFTDIIDTILKTLITRNQGIEVNTSGYKYKLNNPHPKLEIIKRYKELGGQILTVGSDAHDPKYIYSNFDKAYEIIKEAGFSKITLFKNRNPYFINI